MKTAAAWRHPTAVVDRGAHVGVGSKIWHFSHVMRGARIGARCTLGQNVFVAGDAQLGAGCRIQNNVSIYDGVVLEDDVFVGPSAVFTNVRNPRAAVDRRREFERTMVGEGATIGANATIVCGVTIGAVRLRRRRRRRHPRCRAPRHRLGRAGPPDRLDLPLRRDAAAQRRKNRPVRLPRGTERRRSTPERSVAPATPRRRARRSGNRPTDDRETPALAAGGAGSHSRRRWRFRAPPDDAEADRGVRPARG